MKETDRNSIIQSVLSTIRRFVNDSCNEHFQDITSFTGLEKAVQSVTEAVNDAKQRLSVNHELELMFTEKEREMMMNELVNFASERIESCKDSFTETLLNAFARQNRIYSILCGDDIVDNEL